MTDKQPEALTDPQLQMWAEYCAIKEEVARLHEVNAELVEALMAVMDLGGTSLQLIYESREAADKAKAALAKAQGETALQRLNKAAEDNGEEL